MARLLVLCAFTLCLLLPGSASAKVPPPGIIGDWNVSGLGHIQVRAVRNHWVGKVVKGDPDALCLRNDPGRDIWQVQRQLTFPPNAEIFDGSVEYFDFNCNSIGMGQARWDLTKPPDEGTLCGFPPGGGGPQECHHFVRTGPSPEPLRAFSISQLLLTCMIDHAFYASRRYFCNQLYYASKPGRVRTQVYYCSNVGYLPCPKNLSKCAVPPGYPPNQYCTDFSSARTASKKKLVTVASGALKFADAGYGGLDIKPSKKGRKKLKKLANHHKKVVVVVASFFKPTSGKAVIRFKRIKIKGSKR